MINHMIIDISNSGSTSTTNRIVVQIQYKCITMLMLYIHPAEPIESEYIII